MGGGEEGHDEKSRRVIVKARAVCNISSEGLGCSRVWGGQMRAHLDDQRNGGIDSNQIYITWNLQNGSEGGVAENGGTEARCPVCSRSFHSEKAMYGHMRCHPERERRGVNPSPLAKTASSSSVSQEIDGLRHSSMTSTVVSSDTRPSQPPLRWTKTGRRGQNRIIQSCSTLGSSCNIRSLHKEGNQRDNPAYKCRTCKKTFPSYQALIGNRSSRSYDKSPDMENQYVSSSHTSASRVVQAGGAKGPQVPDVQHDLPHGSGSWGPPDNSPAEANPISYAQT